MQNNSMQTAHRHFSVPASLTGDYSGSSSSEEEEDDAVSPRDKPMKNSKGFSDFRIKNIKISPYGRKEIEMAEQGVCVVVCVFWCMCFGV